MMTLETNSAASEGVLQWAGLPIEYWIDLNIGEESSVLETLGELCSKFPEQPPPFHASLIRNRLIHLLSLREISFYLYSDAVQTYLTREEAIDKLDSPETWDLNSDEEFTAYFEVLSPWQLLSNLWNWIIGEPYAGRFSSTRGR
jgi:hypothetical protein